MTNSIEVINLSKSYKSKKAVKNINFKINENEIVGLLGPNGCGKTTTIAMILGLLKPSSGQVFINAFAKLTLFFCPDDSSPVMLFKILSSLNLFDSESIFLFKSLTLYNFP